MAQGLKVPAQGVNMFYFRTKKSSDLKTQVLEP